LCRLGEERISGVWAVVEGKWVLPAAEGKKIDEERNEVVGLFGLGLLAEGDDEEDGLKWMKGEDDREEKLSSRGRRKG
jgi:hypothetical protein